MPIPSHVSRYVSACYLFRRIRQAASPAKPEPSKRREAGSGTDVPPGLSTPVVPISRHCSDSLQFPDDSAGFGQRFALTKSNPPVSRTWPVSSRIEPLRMTCAGLLVQADVRDRAPTLQLFAMSLPPMRTSLSLLSKLNCAVWVKIALDPGVSVKPAPKKPVQRS